MTRSQMRKGISTWLDGKVNAAGDAEVGILAELEHDRDWEHEDEVTSDVLFTTVGTRAMSTFGSVSHCEAGTNTS